MEHEDPRPQSESTHDDRPLVVFDRNADAWVFRNYSDAAGWMEPVDVLDGEYHAYDADGYVLSLSASEGQVTVRRTRERAYDEAVDQLRTAARGARGLAEATLEEMIRELLDQEYQASVRGRVLAGLRWLFRRSAG